MTEKQPPVESVQRARCPACKSAWVDTATLSYEPDQWLAICHECDHREYADGSDSWPASWIR